MESRGASNDEALSEAVKSIEVLVDEAIQVYELNKEKTNVLDELYNSLKIITSYLGFTVDLPSNLLSITEQSRAVLTPALDIIIIKPNFKTEQKTFYQLSLDDASKIIQFAVPTLINMTREDRMQTDKKISSLRSVTQKLKQVPNSRIAQEIANDMSMPVEGIGT